MKGLISISYEQNQPHRMTVHKNENLKYKEPLVFISISLHDRNQP